MKLEVRNVGFDYDGAPALKNIDLEIGEEEILSIVGPNGSGKTTLLRCIATILEPKEGTILLNGRKITQLDGKEKAKKIGYVPQTSSENFPINVFDEVLMGRRPYLSWRPSDKDLEIVSDTLETLGMEKYALRNVNELSGGELQKVLLARAIAQRPKILLLDEPTRNLDLRHQLEVMNLIRTLVDQEGVSGIVAIHDLNLASKYSNRMIMLNDGEVFANGEPNSVLTAENIRYVYKVHATISGNKITRIMAENLSEQTD